MNEQITFRGMDSSQEMKEYVLQHMEKIRDFLKHYKEPIFIHVILSAGRTHHHHTAEINIQIPHFYTHVSFETPEMYLSIDQAIDAMYRKLIEHKELVLDKRMDVPHRGL